MCFSLAEFSGLHVVLDKSGVSEKSYGKEDINCLNYKMPTTLVIFRRHQCSRGYVQEQFGAQTSILNNTTSLTNSLCLIDHDGVIECLQTRAQRSWGLFLFSFNLYYLILGLKISGTAVCTSHFSWYSLLFARFSSSR